MHGYSNCAIMTILEMIKLIFDAHICCNYGNSKNNIMNFSAHNCCNYGNSEKDVAKLTPEESSKNYGNFEKKKRKNESFSAHGVILIN